MKSVHFILIMFVLVVSIIFGPLFSMPFANGQPEGPLPVLLIHGYNSGPSVWSQWLQNLHDDGFIAEAAFFPIDDSCGSSESHALQLSNIIQDFRIKTHSDKINIVAHSKGGLDARMYLANDPFNDDVEKLIMIGTPNYGSPLAIGSLTVPPPIVPFFQAFGLCAPAVFDLIPGSDATQSQINHNTLYYTIAGDWSPSFYYFNFLYPYDTSCHQLNWLPLERWGSLVINGDDDGIVPLNSAAAPNDFINIGVTSDCHTNLFGINEYNMVKDTLLS
jgi:pimeloyl-ACP methyl ester carboxylesterase